MISVTVPIEPAFQRTQKILFQPFNVEKWFVLGFSAFLANLAGGGGGGFRGMNVFRPGAQLGSQGLPKISDWYSGHLVLVVGAGLFILLLIIAFVALFQWLGSRGQFMFLDGVVHDRAQVAEPWKHFRELGNDLFLFQFLLGLAWLGSFVIIGVMVWLIVSPDLTAAHFGWHALTGAILGGGLLLIATLGMAVVVLLLTDFVVPIMYHRTLKTVEAFSVFWNEILPGHIGTFVLFYLMKLVLGIAAAVIIFAGTCLTCCIAGLPYLSSVFFLPIFVFFRCYTLSFLEQFGDAWHLMDRVGDTHAE